MTTSAEKIRAYQGPKLLERGFRPFFLAAGVFAGVAMPVWVGMHSWGLELASPLQGRDWHAHEMLFGYLSAVLAGFLLTAIPNWTGRLPVAGRALGLLVSLWLAGRLAMMFAAGAPVLAAIVDGAFLVVFAGLLWREILAGKNFRNAPVCVIVSVLALANIGFHVLALEGEAIAVAKRVSLAMVAVLISLIGGRIVPSFTRNWMAKNKLSPLPAAFDTVDKIGLASGVVASLCWVVLEDYFVTGVVFVIAGLLYLYRIARWRGIACLQEWLVVILHIGYLWLPVWFLAMAVSIFFPDILTQAAALHALSAGAIGTMTIAVVTRASLGHSGQPLTATVSTKVIYFLVSAGAVLRLLADVLPMDYDHVIMVSGLMWGAGFLLFVWVYTPLLAGRR